MIDIIIFIFQAYAYIGILVVAEWTNISIHAMFASLSQAQYWWKFLTKYEEYMRRWVYF